MQLRHATLTAALVMSFGSAWAAPADELKSLLEQGFPSKAYDLGKKTPDLLGEASFDFFFGIAALDAGAPGEGVLALERFLLQFPENRQARFHVARGYYILGEDVRAHGELAALLPDAKGEERVVIEAYLDAIRARESRYTPTATFFIEAGIGHDSNINAGIRPGAVDGLPGFTVDPSGISSKEADSFHSLQTGVQGSYPVAPGVMLTGGIQAGGRWHWAGANDVFNQSNVQAQGGITVLNGRDLYRTGLEYSLHWVDGAQYLQVASWVGEWAHQTDQYNRLAVGAQFSQLRYEDITVFFDKAKTLSGPSGAPQRNSNFSVLYGTWTHAFTHPWNPVLAGTLNYGHESNVKDRPEYSREVYGARARLSVQPAPKWSLTGELSYQQSLYKDHFAGIAGFPKRRDNFTSLELGASYAIDRNWSIRAEATYADQRSNIGLYQYDRNMVALKVRYDFR